MDPASPPPLDPSETHAFNRWRRQVSMLTGIGLTEEERVQVANRQCEKWKTQALNYSPSILFMLKHLQLSGCPVPPDNIVCIPCGKVNSGGFHPVGAVVLCQDALMSKKRVENTLAHELVHMYDHCKFKVDWSDLRHHACSEIRANTLSGDCHFFREIGRGRVGFSKHFQACVRRRAMLSVKANPSCPDAATAERAVNEVWESCFSDTRPFDEIY